MSRIIWPRAVWTFLILGLLLFNLICFSSWSAPAHAAAWEGVVVHISDSTHMTKDECNDWHRQQGWDGCGYNFVVEPDGAIYEGRGYEKVGAHVRGHNSKYLGFCFVSKDGATIEQLESFRAWLAQTEALYGKLPLYPHNKFANKACPGAVWEQLKLEGIR